MDEYERAAAELSRLLETIDDSSFVADHPAEAENCRSIQKIMGHVVRAAYAFADDIRGALDIPVVTRTGSNSLEDRDESNASLWRALQYTAVTLGGRWSMPESEIEKVTMGTPWGTTYTLEQMLEHAIVHILRHRRQIERLLKSCQVMDDASE